MKHTTRNSSDFLRLRTLVFGLGAALIVILLLLSQLPRLVDSYLKPYITDKLNQIEGLEVGLGQLSLKLSGLHIDQVLVRSITFQQAPDLYFSDVTIEIDPIAFLRGSRRIESISIQSIEFKPHLSDQTSHQEPQTGALTRLSEQFKDMPKLHAFVTSIEPSFHDTDRTKIGGIRMQFNGRLEDARVKGNIRFKKNATNLTTEGNLDAEALSFFHPKISHVPIENMDLALSFNASYDVSRDYVHIDYIKAKSNGIEGILNGTVEQASLSPVVNLGLSIPTVPCQTLIHGIPRQLIPDLQGFQLSGNFSADLNLILDFAALDQTQLSGYRGFQHCQYLDAPAPIEHKRLQESFTQQIRFVESESQVFVVGPENPDYVPYSQFSPALVGAFLAAEDISFFQHSGFVPASLSLAIGQNLMENRFAMGGSTITMQMVKNVLLSHEKTLSRKMQELFLTDYVERTLGKERIFEIYLNVIEFGPGIFGIGPAARHYFAKAAQDLTELESVYLASIIYSPRRHYSSYCRGQISSNWEERLRQLLRLMADTGLISDSAFNASHRQQIVFRSPAVGC